MAGPFFMESRKLVELARKLDYDLKLLKEQAVSGVAIDGSFFLFPAGEGRSGVSSLKRESPREFGRTGSLVRVENRRT